MAKNGCASGCLRMVIMLVLIVALLGVGIYFGGNYALKRFLGDDGEFYKLGINSWEDLFEFLNNLKKLFNADVPEVEDSAKPSDENLNSANQKLGDNIEGYEDGTIFDGGGLVFNGKLILTGGEMAALVQDKIDMVSEQMPLEFSIYAVIVDSKGAELATFAEYTQYEDCEITVMLAINSGFIKDAINNSGVPFASALSGLVPSGNSYLTVVNGYKSVDGQAVLDEEFESQIYLNDGGEMTEQILDILFNATGSNRSDFAQLISGSIISLFNGIGSVTFGKTDDESVVVFDNKYNSELVTKLNIFANVDFEEDYPVAQTELAQIKQEIGQIRVHLANNSLDSTLYTNVDGDIDYLLLQWENFKTAYQTTPNNDTTLLENAVDVLKTILGLS